MKKILKCLAFLSIMGSLCACSSNSSDGWTTTEKEHVPTQEELDDGRELIENQLYTDDGFLIEFEAKGARISKMYFGDLLIAHDGFVAGRCANRIKDATFELNGETYNVDKNDGDNHLHGGSKGFGEVTWEKVEQHPSSITYKYHAEDGEMGYPGAMDIQIKYTLLNTGELILEYSAKSDADTLCNPTNHIWLSLNGANANDHTLWINADKYTPRDEKLIPTGEIASVEGTKYDFREEKAFVPSNNYDDNWVLNGEGFRKVCTLTGTESGIKCEISTDRPGLQMYNNAKDIVLETQLYPDAIHHPEWPSPILRANTDFHTKSIYAFTAPEA